MIQKMHIRQQLYLLRKIRAVDSRLKTIENRTEIRDMLAAHVAFLDHLSAESAGCRDYRSEFVTWYLTHRRKKGRTTS